VLLPCLIIDFFGVSQRAQHRVDFVADQDFDAPFRAEVVNLVKVAFG